jgi:DNA (cytosine-5)-methyltransferase 1
VSARPRIFDGFCCAGGAGHGYALAGFDPYGVDISPQPNYPYRCREADVLALDPVEVGREFDAIHLSPMCQGYTEMVAPGQVGAPRLIPAARAWCEATGKPFIIENVVGAACDMLDAILLCGTMFNLGAHGCELQRHRLFISNVPIAPPGACQHSGAPVVGIYGDHARIRSGIERGRPQRWPETHREVMNRALGTGWMTAREASEAIPPAYTEHLGRQLLAAIR